VSATVLTFYAMSHILRGKHDAKRSIKYTVLVTGPSGTGKSTFINCLLDTDLIPHRYKQSRSLREEPKILSYIGTGDNVHAFRSFNSAIADFDETTMAITSNKLEVSDAEDDTKLDLTIIDTPGFGDNLDNEPCIDEIIVFLKQQFDHVLSEETRIRRNPRFEDTRVHICLYFIEPTGHGLRELDVEVLKKLSQYVNVLPVIGKADSFTAKELADFKKNILNDVVKYSIPIFEFNYDEDEDDLDIVEDTRTLAKLQPFAVISSKEKVNGKYVRSYPWGQISIDEASDFQRLKNCLFGSHLQDFKDLTTNFLYENYRTEKLSSVTDEESKTSKEISASNPSLSNLAALTAQAETEDKIKAEESHHALTTSSLLADGASFHTKPESEDSKSFKSQNSGSSFRPDIHNSPIKEISRSIKRDNESYIESIKNSPRLQYSPEPSRNKLRIMSETVPYVLKHENILSRQLKLQELEEKSARELALRAAALERKAAELKKRERLLRNGSITSTLKKENTFTDLSSIVKDEE
jgi:septin 1 family protein